MHSVYSFTGKNPVSFSQEPEIANEVPSQCVTYSSLNLRPLFEEFFKHAGVFLFLLEILSTVAVEISQNSATLLSKSPSI